MTASVVSNRPATDAAFWRAERTTFVQSITPARTKSSYSTPSSLILLTGVLAEQGGVPSLDIQRHAFPVLAGLAEACRQDFAVLWFPWRNQG